MSDSIASSYTEDTIVISGGEDITIDLGDYTAAQPTYNIDTSNMGTITLDPSIYTITGGGGASGSTITYSTDYSWNSLGTNGSSVNINNNGITMKSDSDLKIGDRSLKDFMDSVEERLGILRPNPELEDRWEQLKELRKQYQALEKDLLEKEKIMKILKEQ